MEDIAPLVLYLLGLEIPKHMDGSLPTNLFSKNFLSEHPPRYVEDIAIPGHIGDVTYADEEEEDIRKQLTSLGYL